MIQTAKRAQLRDSPESAPCLCTHTVLFFLFVNTLLASLLSVFVEILFCKAKGPGPLSLTTGLVARIYCFCRRHPAQSLVGIPGPAPSFCRPRPPKVTMRDSDGASEFEFSQCFSKWGELTLILSVGCCSEAAKQNIGVQKKRDQKLLPREIKMYLLEP